MNTKYILIITLFSLVACSADKEQKQQRNREDRPFKPVAVPAFNADSAYEFVEQQVAFGPRIPNTKAHMQASEFFVETLKRYGAQITIQEFQQQNFSGTTLNLKNIVASFNPDKSKRILLAAHWDTRPFSDKDADKPNATFQGANDGASGVAVLLEIARVLHTDSLPGIGVDMIFFDGEDWGEREGQQQTHPLPDDLQEWWCLGSQHWARNKHKPNYSAYYGILLDMVGAANAQFHQEGYSMQFAPTIVRKVWDHAHRLGYSHVFIKKNQAEVTDDHLFVNTLARIPMINIIHYEPGIGYFGDFHHTQRDNIDLISKDMLGIVGNTVLNVLYHEGANTQ